MVATTGTPARMPTMPKSAPPTKIATSTQMPGTPTEDPTTKG